MFITHIIQDGHKVLAGVIKPTEERRTQMLQGRSLSLFASNGIDYLGNPRESTVRVENCTKFKVNI